MEVKVDDGVLTVARPTNRGEHRALHGLTRSLIANMVEGVTNGFEKRLQIQGVGYRAKPQGKALELALGFSHPVNVEAPEGIEFEVPQPTEIIVRGIDKQLVGEMAAQIRKPPPARALQGQGRALRRRARRAARSASGHEPRPGVLMAVKTHSREGCAAAGASGRRSAAARERPRLAVYRSNRGLFAQLIDDDERPHDRPASWTEAELRKLEADGAGEAGRRAARRARQGRRASRPASSIAAATATTASVAALADGAREGGLKF